MHVYPCFCSIKKKMLLGFRRLSSAYHFMYDGSKYYSIKLMVHRFSIFHYCFLSWRANFHIPGRFETIIMVSWLRRMLNGRNADVAKPMYSYTPRYRNSPFRTRNSFSLLFSMIQKFPASKRPQASEWP